MAEGYPTEKLLRKVIEDLSDFLPHLVLVGGWVPYLYEQYIWPEELTGKDSGKGVLKAVTVVSTTDMDFGVTLASYGGDESIADRVKGLGYGEHHLYSDKMSSPFVPIAKGKDDNEKAEVEFITVLNPPKHIHEKLVGKAIILNKLRNFEILLENARKFMSFSRAIQIPTEATFVFHKLLTFVLRENEDKLRKDLYYVYYMLRFCPDKTRLVNSVKSLIKKRKEGKKVLRNIDKYFAHKDAKGPVFIEKEFMEDYFVSNVREDAYDRITRLL